MANIGEAIGLAGINQSQPVIDDFAAGFSVGDRMAARKNEKEQKLYDLIKQSTRMKPGSFFSNTLSQKAQEAVVNHNYKIAEGVKKYGQKFLYTPEAQQSMQETDFVVNNLKAEDDRVKNWYGDVQAGKIVDDPEFRAAHSGGDWNKYLQYQNKNLGFRVDPNGLSNVRGIKKYDLNKDYDSALSDEKYYTEKAERNTLAGGEGFYNFKIPQKGIDALAGQLASDPDRINFLIATRGNDLAPRVEALRQLSAQTNNPFDEHTAIQVAAKELIAQDLKKLGALRRITRNYSISEGGSGQQIDSGVGDVVPGSFNFEEPIYKGKTDKQGNKVPEKQGRTTTVTTDYSFQIKPTPALVAATSNTYDLNGKRINDPEVRNAQYGQFAIVPVYKGMKGATSGKDISGRIVSPEDMDRIEKSGKSESIEYVPVAIGSYQKKGSGGELEEVSIYRPVTEIEGAVTSSGSAAYKKAMRERIAEMKQVAAQKNGGSAPKTQKKETPAERAARIARGG